MPPALPHRRESLGPLAPSNPRNCGSMNHKKTDVSIHHAKTYGNSNKLPEKNLHGEKYTDCAINQIVNDTINGIIKSLEDKESEKQDGSTIETTNSNNQIQKHNQCTIYEGSLEISKSSKEVKQANIICSLDLHEPNVDEAIKNGHCSICFESYSYDDDLLVFCDTCELPVHQSCYGISVIPEGEWNCSTCTAGIDKKDAKCILCGRWGGAMKQTRDNKWAHLLCSWWDSNATVEDVDIMEPIAFLTKPLASREITCVLCQHNIGFSIPCRWEGCARMFHPMCARQKGYLNIDIESGCVLQQAYCDRHKNYRVSIQEIIKELLHSDEAKSIIRIRPKLQEILDLLNGGSHYQCLDNVSKDLINIFKRNLEVKGSMEKCRRNTLALMRKYLDMLPQLRRVYESATLYEHELISSEIQQQLNESFQTLSSENCSVCRKAFLPGQLRLYCLATCSSHVQHFKCLKKAKNVKSNSETRRNNYICGSCQEPVDSNIIIGLNTDELVNLIKANNNTTPKKKSGPEPISHRKRTKKSLPLVSNLNLEITKNIITSLEMILKDPSTTTTEIPKCLEWKGKEDAHLMNRLKMASRYYQKGFEPLGRTIVSLLLVDYKVLADKRIKYEIEQKQAERKRKEIEEEHRMVLEKEDQRRKDAELRLIEEQNAVLKASGSTLGITRLRGRGKKRKTTMTQQSKEKEEKRTLIQKKPIGYRRCLQCKACARVADCQKCLFCVSKDDFELNSQPAKKNCIMRICMNPQPIH